MSNLPNAISLLILYCSFVACNLPLNEDEEEGMDSAEVMFNESALMNPEETDPYGDIIGQHLLRSGIKNENRRWDNGVVPYVISRTYGMTRHRDYRNLILKAMDEIQNVSCVRFVPRTNERDYITIENTSGCRSYVGRRGGNQPLFLRVPNCFGNGTGSVKHELMHVLGFIHEHTRPDRDKYISVKFENLPYGDKTGDYVKINRNLVNDFGLPYDLFSIMHYSENANSINGKKTIQPHNNMTLSPSLLSLIGQRVRLSDYDVLKLNFMYKCTRITDRWYINGTCGGFAVGNTTFYYSGGNAWYISEDSSWTNLKNNSRYISRNKSLLQLLVQQLIRQRRERSEK